MKRRKGPAGERMVVTVTAREATRVAVHLPEELRRRLKAHAAKQGLTMAEVLARWIDEYTARH